MGRQIVCGWESESVGMKVMSKWGGGRYKRRSWYVMVVVMAVEGS